MAALNAERRWTHTLRAYGLHNFPTVRSRGRLRQAPPGPLPDKVCERVCGEDVQGDPPHIWHHLKCTRVPRSGVKDLWRPQRYKSLCINHPFYGPQSLHRRRCETRQSAALISVLTHALCQGARAGEGGRVGDLSRRTTCSCLEMRTQACAVIKVSFN